MQNAQGMLDDERFDDFADGEHMYGNNNAGDFNLDHHIPGPLAVARRIQDRLIAERFV